MSFFPKRPDTGTVGKRIVLRANFFPLTSSPHTKVYQYSFIVNNPGNSHLSAPKLRKLYRLWEDIAREAGWLQITPMFDGKCIIYSPVPFPMESISQTFVIDSFVEDGNVGSNPSPDSLQKSTTLFSLGSDMIRSSINKPNSLEQPHPFEPNVSETTLVSSSSAAELTGSTLNSVSQPPVSLNHHVYSNIASSDISSAMSTLSIASSNLISKNAITSSLASLSTPNTALLSKTSSSLSMPTSSRVNMLTSPKRPRWYHVTVARLPELDMHRLHLFLEGRLLEAPVDCITMLDVLLRQRPSLLYTNVGRSFFTPEHAITIANGAQLWRGFHQSLIPAMGQMLLNLDVSATAFYQPGSVLETAAKLLGRNTATDLRGPPLNEKDRIKLDRHFKGLKITINHRGDLRRKYRINRVALTNANRTVFPLNDHPHVEESVYQYFLRRYHRRLQYPHLPVLIAGDPEKPVYLPMEVCDLLPGQRHMRKLNEKQTAEMIKFTCQPPHVRSGKIQNGIQLIQEQDNDYFQAYGVSVGSEMAAVSARVLPPPVVSYHPSSKEPVISPKEGAWNLRDKMLAQGIVLRSWAVVAFGTEHDYPAASIHHFLQLLIQTCQECGLYVENRQPPISYAPPTGNMERTLIDAYVVAGNTYQERPQLIVCVLPNTSVPLYAEIKRVSDTVIGIPTQCIQARHMFAAKRQYCANVCLKINVKLGGMNSYLSAAQLPFVAEMPTIILGADISHPTSGSGSNQSTAALVGSIDAHCSRYAAAIRVQPAKQDHIQDLKGMVIEILKTFFQFCGSKPQRIVYYRDGISEPAFADVSRREIEAIRLACMELEDMYKPSITYIVVQKRHHARFFPLRKEDTDRSGNVLPGTVVETGVTHPFEFDFYLCSHPGLQGTSKPTHYHVLFDENRFKSDTLQELTYRLCYLYCRATRSVSVVPPAYYAHLVAARARFHAVGEDQTMSDSASIGSGGSQGLNHLQSCTYTQPSPILNPHPSLHHPYPLQQGGFLSTPIGPAGTPMTLGVSRRLSPSPTPGGNNNNLISMQLNNLSSPSSYTITPSFTASGTTPSLSSAGSASSLLHVNIIPPTSSNAGDLPPANNNTNYNNNNSNLAPFNFNKGRSPSGLMLHTSPTSNEAKSLIFAQVKAELAHVMYFM